MWLASGQKKYPALVLNADYRPLSYFPLSLWSWQTTVKAVFLDRVNVIHEYKKIIHSPTFEIKLPSVIALKSYIQHQRKPAFTKFNLFLRDGFQCQYCGNKKDLTFDHVIPTSRGGRTNWRNVVAACSRCNVKKGSKSLQEAGMHLLTYPRQPDSMFLHNKGREFPPNYLHDTWIDFLYWDSVLEQSDQKE